MPWKRDQAWQWTDSQWKARPNRKQEKDQQTNKGKPIMTGYDGKQVYVGGSQQHSAASSSQETSLREENHRLREAIKFVVGKVATEEEIPDFLKDITKENPREILKQKQKALNEERKNLNRLEKVREQIAAKETKFTEWKHSVKEGVLQEEKRHSTQVAELQAKLKSIEQGEEDAAIVVDSDGEADVKKDARSRQLEQELGTMKEQMQQMISYTAHMEAKNNMMLEQIQMQMSTLIGGMAGATLAEGMKPNSPEQHVHHRRVMDVIDTSKRDAAPRSRSPAKRAKVNQVTLSSPRANPKLDYSPTKLKGVLADLPEEVQSKALGIMNSDPHKYATFVAVDELIQTLLQVWNLEQAPTIRTEEGLPDHLTEVGMTDSSVGMAAAVTPLPIAVSTEHDGKRDALRPFGRFKPNKEGPAGPYTSPGGKSTPGNSRKGVKLEDLDS